MGLYHLSVKIIGRGSGRSAVGAAAYRAGEKLQATAHAAYQSGNKLYAEGDKITHDYTRKGGVVHSEIILPENAPIEYQDRETLWNAVERKEKRADARLAREIEVALQTEFTLEENKEILREYIQQNFVNEGMIADFAIHDNGGNLNSPAVGAASGVRNQTSESAQHHAANPHAHIMLTMREVTPDGFGNKNREWDKKEKLLNWRKNWADINNRKFEGKGLAERLDHRTLKEQGLDREPTIHMGHKAWALEKKGIRTQRGDYNREIKRRNEKRAAQRAEKERRIAEAVERINNVRNAQKNNHGRTELINQTAKHKTTPECATTKLIMREIEEHLKAKKADKIVEKMQAKREAEKTAKQMHELKENYIALEKELLALTRECGEHKQEIPQLTFLAENMDEQAKNIETLRSKATQLQAERQRLGFWDGRQKKESDKAIAQAEGNLLTAQHHFKKEFGFAPDEAPLKIKHIQEQAREKENALNEKNARISAIKESQAAIILEYHAQKLLAEIRPNSEQIFQLLEHMKKPPQTLQERLQHEQANRRLNTITNENFQKVLETLPEPQAKILIEQRNRAEEKEYTKLCEQTKAYELSYTC